MNGGGRRDGMALTGLDWRQWLGDRRKGTTSREVGRYWAKNQSGLGSFDSTKNEREKEISTWLARSSRANLD
jgi:hypothetical protein